jgi:hypothetical protein
MMMPAPGMSADVWDNTTDLLASINPFGKKVRISPLERVVHSTVVHGDFGNFLIPEVTFSAHLYEAVAMHLQSLNLSSGNMMLDRERREWTYDFSLFFKEKLLSPTDFIPLSLYNMRKFEVVSCRFNFLHGGNFKFLKFLKLASCRKRDVVVPTVVEPIDVKVHYNNLVYNVSSVTFCDELYNVVQAFMEMNVDRYDRDVYWMSRIPKFKFNLYFREKPILNKHILLCDYNMRNKSELTIKFNFGLGGSPPLEMIIRPEIIPQCEIEVCKVEKSRLQLQSTPFSKFLKTEEYVSNYALKLIEDVSIFAYHVVSHTSKTDLVVAVINFAKLRSDGPIVRSSLIQTLNDMIQELYGELVLQSTPMESARQFLDNYDDFSKSPLIKKLYKLAMYCLANELFSGVGINMTKLQYSRLAQEAIRKEYYLGPSFVHCLFDTMLFLCEQGTQCIKLGTFAPLIHSSKTYQKWFDDAINIKVKSKLLANPEPHGFTKFEFLKDLADAIERGENISKFASEIGQNERKLVRSVLCEMKMIQADNLTKGAAQKTRKAPFSILVYAGSSVGKSTFTDILYSYHARVANLPEGSEYKYAVNFADEFQSGFTTNQWCWLIDDAAFMHPDKAQGIDPSVLNVIQAVNNAPYITNQADLPDKGRIPMCCELVIGTTNTKNLNAHLYFSNPLAVQRRFPYVITLKPKAEYARDECMLDGQKVKMVEDDEYPNWWDIKVERVTPLAGQPIDRQYAEYSPELETDEISEFLCWYKKVWEKHDKQQKKVIEGNDKFKNIKMCDCHFVPLRNCPQFSELHLQSKQCDCDYDESCIDCDDDFSSLRSQFGVMQEPIPIISEVEEKDNTISSKFNLDDLASAGIDIFKSQRAEKAAWDLGIGNYFIYWILQFGSYCFLEFTLFRSSVRYLYRFHVFRQLIWCFLLSATSDSRIIMHLFSFMGDQVHRKIGKIPLLVTLAGLLTVGFSTFKLASWIFGSKIKPQSIRARDVGVRPKEHEERGENVWYKSEFKLTPFDVPTSAQCLTGNLPHLITLVEKNTLHVICRKGDGKMQCQGLLGLGGQIYVANNHGIPICNKFEMEIIQREVTDGVTPNLKIIVTPSMIRRCPEVDLCIIEIQNLPPKKDLMKYIPQNFLPGVFKGKLVTRDMLGKISNRKAAPIRPNYHDINGYIVHSYECTVDVPTQNGDCGSSLVVESGHGCFIAGIHALGGDNISVCTPLTREVLQPIMKTYRLQVNEGNPKLSSKSVSRTVENLHEKSVIRYIEDGSADVYGTFAGFRRKPTSGVTKSYICDAVCDTLGTTVQHGKPLMSGWVPWRRAAVEMLKPTTLLDQDILNNCVKAFICDIESSLPEDEFKLIEVYDNFTAINGANGVKFVDKMPRDTSMGAPWCKSKKHFLIDDPIDDYPEAVCFTDEIMDRVDDIEERYISGERTHPVFTGHLKDEPTKFSKIAIGKTRVFTGAPVDWTIVVRKYFLSSIRVIQRNKYIFEAGPGTNPQSIEWDQIGRYLTKYGEDRMIAGDYAAFDKSMPPSIILAAFDILIWMCGKAGYTHDDLQICKGVAMDTAFPLVDFNGDLIQFFGSNPSGHPLTVIINGLANSLYMRYCYYQTNPNKECSSFKKNVALMTYGDDNIMGVSKSVDWFNHTTIQETLKTIGITYTMADKDSESIPYVSLKDVSFLKRTWRFDEDLDCYLAPLELASIHKMLTVNVRSKTIPAEEQSIATITSALGEWFFYGKEEYNARRQDMIHVIEMCDLNAWLQKSSIPTWDMLKMRFEQNSQYYLR